jgi:hypothetical protein
MGGTWPHGGFTRDHVREIRSRFHPATSIAATSVILLSVVRQGTTGDTAWTESNSHVMKLHRQASSHGPWPDPVIHKFETEATTKPNAQLALLILLYTGQRVGDVAAVRWQHYDARALQSASRRPTSRFGFPCHSRRRDAIEPNASRVSSSPRSRSMAIAPVERTPIARKPAKPPCTKSKKLKSVLLRLGRSASGFNASAGVSTMRGVA